ncbi:MAG: PLP-dependent aminotransferase family protein [Pseudomonadota bacterium]|nr:PLP-dependent aminotransferase family protein [Pseudomonadota bacterium]
MKEAAPRADVVHFQRAPVDDQLRDAVEDPRVVSLAGGVPADELFPVQQIEAALADSLRRDAAKVLQYGWPGGLGRLRVQIAAEMARRGVDLAPEQILITSGAQQALSLLAQLLVPLGAAVAVETPTYISALQAFDLRKPAYLAIPRTTAGIDLAALDRALGREKARVFYVVASGHNPTGGVLTRDERQAVLACAERHDAWVIEDDAYGEIQYGSPERPLLAFERHLAHTVHVGSFSKVLAPGLRVGWIAGSLDLIREATRVKQAGDLETATLTQRVLSAWLDAHRLEDHVARCVTVYRARRDALVESLRDRMPPEVSWGAPDAGFSMLLQLPAPLQARALLPDAVARGMAFEPAEPYFVHQANPGALRLSFANVREPEIRRAVDRLAGVVRAAMGA